MDEKKLKVKDLITIGVFAIIYFVLMIGIGMIGIIPILFLIYPTILGIVTGTVLLLFMAKVAKPWALLIFGMLSPFIMFVMGHSVILPILAFIPIFIGEMIRRGSGYRSVRGNILAFAFFNMWICGSLMQMLLVKEEYLKMTHEMMGADYTNALERLITYPHMALVYVGAFVGGLIGGFIGKAMLKKHFEKAGVA